jgi:hypothetical protein
MDILKCIDNGGHVEIACSLGLSCSTVSTIIKNRDKIMEYVKSEGSLLVSNGESKVWCVD